MNLRVRRNHHLLKSGHWRRRKILWIPDNRRGVFPSLHRWQGGRCNSAMLSSKEYQSNRQHYSKTKTSTLVTTSGGNAAALDARAKYLLDVQNFTCTMMEEACAFRAQVSADKR